MTDTVRRFFGREWSWTAVLIAVVVIGTFIVMLPGIWAPGPEFDEGILLSFPTRVLEGDLPYRDFETFYGPASSGFTAAAFLSFGSSLAVERAIGIAFRLLAVLGVLLLARRFGPIPMIASGVLAGVLMAAPGAWADNENQAQALVVIMVVLAARGAESGSPSRWAKGPQACYLVAGLTAGCAALFRWEFAPIAVVVAAPLLVTVGWRLRGAFAAGFLVGLAPYVPVLAAAGYSRIHENLADLRATSSDRRLPLPQFGSEPMRVFLVVFVALVLLWVVALVVRRGDRRPVDDRLLLALALFGALQVPFAFSRFDIGHAVAAAFVPLAFAPVSTAELVPTSATARRVGPIATFLVVLVAILSTSYGRSALVMNARIALGRPHGAKVSLNGRTFVLTSAVDAADLQAILSEVDRRVPPGSRLFVGPRDLRRAYANDAFVYYLLPKLHPASFYIELDPPVVRSGSRLARDVASADYLILNSHWDTFDEPNATAEYGSPAANEIVRRRFCSTLHRGTYTLFARCR